MLEATNTVSRLATDRGGEGVRERPVRGLQRRRDESREPAGCVEVRRGRSELCRPLPIIFCGGFPFPHTHTLLASFCGVGDGAQRGEGKRRGGTRGRSEKSRDAA